MDYKEQVLRAMPTAYVLKDTYKYNKPETNAAPYNIVYGGPAHAPGQLVEASLQSAQYCFVTIIGRWQSSADLAWEHAYTEMQRKAIELLSE